MLHVRLVGTERAKRDLDGVNGLVLANQAASPGWQHFLLACYQDADFAYGLRIQLPVGEK